MIYTFMYFSTGQKANLGPKAAQDLVPDLRAVPGADLVPVRLGLGPDPVLDPDPVLGTQDQTLRYLGSQFRRVKTKRSLSCKYFTSSSFTFEFHYLQGRQISFYIDIEVC